MASGGIEAVYRKPDPRRKHPENKISPCLLKNLAVTRVNQVGSAAIPHIPMRKGFVYLAAVMAWFSRRVLAWRLSITMETGICVEAPKEAMARLGKPEILNPDRGVQFTAASFIATLADQGVRISHGIAERDPFGSPWTARVAISTTSSTSADGAA